MIDAGQPAVAASPLADRLDHAQQDERRQAMRALLARPLLLATGRDADAHGLVRRHAAWLRRWFEHNTGWSLTVDSELARLYKTPGDLGDPTRSALDPASGEPFDRRRCMLVCLCLAVLHDLERQTVLGAVAERVTEIAALDLGIKAAGMTIDLGLRDHRRDLVQAVRYLIDLGVLIRIDGDEEQFVRRQGDVLYTIDRAVLSAVLGLRRGPSTIEELDFDDRIAGIVAEEHPDTDEGRSRHHRWTLTRRLLDDPVVHLDELDDAQRQYLASQRPRLVREIEACTGLVPEARAEGVAMVDPSGSLTDLDMPEEGTEGHAALLTAQWLAEIARAGRDEQQPPSVDLAALHAHLAGLIQQHRHQLRHWSQAVEAPGYERVLADRTLDRLEALRLVRRRDDRIEPRPTIARYAIDEPVEPPPLPRRAKTGADVEAGAGAPSSSELLPW